MSINKLVLLLIFLSISTYAYATTYTVGPGKTYATISACSLVAGPGDTCAVYPGVYNETVTISKSGTAGNPITFVGVNSSGVPTACAVDSNNNPTSPSSCSILYGFSITGYSYITMNDFYITNSQTYVSGYGTSSGLFLQTANNNIFENSTIAMTTGGCINFHPTSPSYLSNNNVIQNNNISGCGHVISGGIGWVAAPGIVIFGSNNLVQNNIITHIGEDYMRDLGGAYNVIRNNIEHDNSILDADPGYPNPITHIDNVQTFPNFSTSIDVAGTGYVVGDVLNIIQAGVNPGGAVLSEYVVSPGSGYTINDILTIPGGTGATATVVGTNPLITATINTAGTGYVVGDVLTVGGGTHGTVTVATIGAGGSITSAPVSYGGMNYAISGTGETVSGGHGTGAKFNITSVSGSVAGLSLTTGGSGYSNTLNVYPTGGTGSGVQINISDQILATVSSINGSGGITGINNLTQSALYTNASNLSSTYLAGSGSGLGATFNITSNPPMQYLLFENNIAYNNQSNDQHFTIFQDESNPQAGAGNVIIRYNEASNYGSAITVNNQQVFNVSFYNNTFDNMDIIGKTFTDLSCYNFYTPSEGYYAGATGCQILNNIYYNTVYNASSQSGNEDYVDTTSKPGFYADYNLAFNSACFGTCTWGFSSTCPGIGCPLTGQETHSVLNHNPTFTNAPLFGITVTGNSSSTSVIDVSVTSSNANGNYTFTIGDNIEYNQDGVDRVVTAVTPGVSFTLSPALSGNSIQGDALLDWGSSTNFTYDLSLLVGSPAANTGGPLTTVANTDDGSSTTLIVNNANLFQWGWAGVNPDVISVTNWNNTATISTINYSTNTITLTAPITRSPGDPVWLYSRSDGTQVLGSNTPNIGAFQGTPTPPPPPPVKVNPNIISGATIGGKIQ